MSAIVRKLKRKLRKSDTVERCGFVLKDGSILETKNMHEKPETGFVMSARDIIDHEDELVASWHTHPGMTAALSQEDYLGFSQWPMIKHYIIGTDGVRCYAVDEGFVREVALASD